MSFKGTFTYAVDSKGRINIPLRLRKYLSPDANDTFVITRGFDTCLFLYPLNEWNRLEQSIRELNPSDSRHRFVLRTLLQWAAEVQLDQQSRIIIPRELLQFATIDTAVRVIGVLDHIEIWNPDLFEKYMNAQGESYESVAQTVLRK